MRELVAQIKLVQERDFTPETLVAAANGDRVARFYVEKAATEEKYRWVQRTAYACQDCIEQAIRAERFVRPFRDGEVVFRRWQLRPTPVDDEPRRHLSWYCETCVRTRHPTGWMLRHNPVPCAGGCGVFVTHGYLRLPTITTCSPRCAAVAAAARRAAHRTPVGCADCGQPFQPGRVDAVFCSDACRQRAYRKRKRAA